MQNTSFKIYITSKQNFSFKIQYNRTVFISVLFGYWYRNTGSWYAGLAQKCKTIDVQEFYESSEPWQKSSFNTYTVQYSRTVLISVILGFRYRITGTRYAGLARKIQNY